MQQTMVITEQLAGSRLDRALQQLFAGHSRSYLQQLIEHDCVSLNDIVIKKSSIPVKTGDHIHIQFPASIMQGALPIPDNLGVELLYEHDDFLVVYKPAGLLVHKTNHSLLLKNPRKQNKGAKKHDKLKDEDKNFKNQEFAQEITLVDWLIHQFKELSTVGEADRPGIVHRLDKDTSGVLIIPRTPQAHAHMSTLFQERRMEKRYLAVVHGHPPLSGSIDYPIGRHPHQKHKMSHKPAHGRDALTHYQVLTYFKDSALVEVHPITGRTHQIRVHFASIGHPILGDSVYGTEHPLIKRQALHAYQLSLNYKDKFYSIWRDMPYDMQNLIKQL